ncbi:hypothetical protein chiPu_0003026 [Chiloscyllium punctatum]|uniref:BIG2 domain-containing protein n=1 Tax=Chiloscyllium punctatum TaxID=137246 RepID=A0A401S2L5_CHIPU|nr:hypothetical protein [Chiloscyllium punctatum]
MAAGLWARLLFLAVVGFRYIAGTKLNVPKVLLPYSATVKVNFTLEADEGCYLCLEGFIFEWSIVKNEDMDNIAESPSKIRIMKFSESTYLPPAHIARMEKDGLQGDIILVSGLMTGTANLKTRLQDAIYKNVPAASIRVTILENIILSPAHDIYLLIGSIIRYRVAKVVNGKMTEIEMPSEQYKLELKSGETDSDVDRTVAELDSDTCIVTASAFLRASAGFSVFPGERWVLEVGRTYEFRVEVYDKSSNKVYLSDNLNIGTNIPETHFRILNKSLNGTYYNVDVLLAGQEIIKASLFGVAGESLVIPITNHQEVTIYEPIILKPKVLVFPWHPKPRSYRHLIQVNGGSGNFTWSSGNESVALVTVKGVIATSGSRGFSIIHARDVENPIHFGKMQVNVLRPVSIEFVQSRVEIEVGQTLDLPIMVYGLMDTDAMETVPVNNCTLMNLAVEMDKQGVFKVIQGRLEPDAAHCTGIRVEAETPGHTVLTASAGFLEVHFSSSITIASYQRLRVPVSFCRNTILELTAYDKYGRKFDNFTSLQINWKSSNFSLGSFHPAIQMEMFLRDDGSGQKRLHGHRMVVVYKRKGTVTISVYLVGYGKTDTDLPQSHVGVRFSPVSATIDLLLVDDVSLVPKNLTVYNHPDVLEIVYLTEGSGYFFVNTTDTEILTSTYLETKNYVQIRPLQPGFVTMKAYDLCLTCKGPARAEICVSDILDFELNFIHKIEIGKSVPVNVRVLDFFKKPFLNRYFRYMNISLQAASPIVTLEPITDLDKYAASYLLRAVALGQTTLIAMARDKFGRKLSSSPRQIEVFPPFRLIPQKVTLIIGGMMQVMSEGGPQPQTNIHFSINNGTIAEVNELGQLTALMVGTAKVTGIIQAADDDTGKVVVFSKDEVTVNVIQLRGIKIHAPVTRLRTGTQLPVYVVGVTSCQTPFTFGSAVPGLTFHWTTTKREVIELVSRHSEISLQLSAEHNFAMLLYSKAEGKTGLKVTVTSQNPSAAQFEGNFDRFSDEIQIMVFGILQLLPLSLPAKEVLMSPNSHLKLQTSRDGKAYVNYEVRKCPHNKSVIMEDGHGVLTSGPRTGSSALTVTSLEYFGLNQTIVTGVRVAPVAYLSINTSPKLHIAKNEELAAVPLGMTLTFMVNFYDLSGEQFHAHNTELYLAVNRDDLLLIGPGTRNNTYVAQAANIGLTLLAVWDNRHPGIADYIPIPTQYAIWPNISEHVILSDVICFSSVLVNQEGEPGNWYQLSSEVLQIDPATGLGVTRSTGSTTVYYEIPGIVRTYREITVIGVGKASVSFHGFTCVIGRPNINVYRFLVTTMNKDSSLRGDCSFAQVKAMSKLNPASNLACSVRFSNIGLQFLAVSVFSVVPEFIADTGHYSCTVTIKELSDSVHKELSIGGDTYISVKASVLGGHYAGQVGRTEIPFIPGFYMNQSVVTLSCKEPTVNITIFGIAKVLNELEVRSQSPVIVVSKPVRSHSLHNVVYSLSTANLSLLQQGLPCTNISVSSILTKQSVHVTVTVLRSGGNGGTTGEFPFEESTFFDQLVESYQVLMFTLFAVLATTAIIFIAYNAFLTRIQTIPVIYVSTTPQTGYNSTTPCSNPRRRYLQSWLWSVR